MGKHQGWGVTPRNGRFLARVWDPIARRHANRTWDTASEAKAWAREQHALFVTRQSSAAKAVTATLADDYLRDLERRGRSPSHLADSKLVLKRLVKALPDPTIPRAAAVVEAWLTGMDELAPATRNRYLVTAKSLMAWATARGHLLRNPLAVVRAESLPDRLKPQFTLDELRKLVAASADHYHLQFCLLLYTGMRLDEAVHMRWQDVDVTGGVLAIRLEAGARVKRNKERLVPIQPELAALLAAVRPTSAEGAILGEVGQHRGERFARFLRRCKIPMDGRTPHSTRHTYAGLMTASGVPTALVAAYMGHASTSTTAIYTRLAARYVTGCAGWDRGAFRLFDGAVSSWPRVVVDLAAKGGASRSEAKTAAARENGKRFGGRRAKKSTADLLAAPSSPIATVPASASPATMEES